MRSVLVALICMIWNISLTQVLHYGRKRLWNKLELHLGLVGSDRATERKNKCHPLQKVVHISSEFLLSHHFRLGLLVLCLSATTFMGLYVKSTNRCMLYSRSTSVTHKSTDTHATFMCTLNYILCTHKTR